MSSDQLNQSIDWLAGYAAAMEKIAEMKPKPPGTLFVAGPMSITIKRCKPGTRGVTTYAIKVGNSAPVDVLPRHLKQISEIALAAFAESQKATQ